MFQFLGAHHRARKSQRNISKLLQKNLKIQVSLMSKRQNLWETDKLSPQNFFGKTLVPYVSLSVAIIIFVQLQKNPYKHSQKVAKNAHYSVKSLIRQNPYHQIGSF